MTVRDRISPDWNDEASYSHSDEAPQRFVSTLYVEDLATAQRIAATFPKMLRVKAMLLTEALTRETVGMVELHVDLTPTDGNPVNERGLKRLRRFEALRAGGSRWTTPYANSYPSRDAFDAAL